jgi:hypothetical protein
VRREHDLRLKIEHEGNEPGKQDGRDGGKNTQPEQAGLARQID